MATIGDSVATVRLNLGNRSDLDVRISNWLAHGYQDLGMSYPFEELEQTIDDTFLPNIDIYNYPDGVRAIKTISMTPFANQQQPVKRKDIKIVRRYNTTSQTGPPSIYGPFNRTILVRPVPSQAFPFKWDVWMKPSIDFTDTASINASIVVLPDDWIEILEYMATLRGHIGLLERDKAGELHTLLYGDPTDVSQPGLIKTKLLIHSAESYDSEYGTRPKIRAYSHTGTT
jgi:hypothetical protein